MESEGKKKGLVTWILFGGAGVLVVAGLVLQLVNLKPEPVPPPPLVNVPPPAPTPPPVVVIEAPAPTPPPQPATPPPAPVERPRIDVVFALDTTSSMTGLIEGAKQKIWSIASHIASGRPTPELRVGLVPYRDRGDAYVTQVFPLTSNLDEVYARLRTFKAQGGGDPPEAVRRALMDSIRKMDWAPGKNVMRVVFLVGDSPPNEYSDEPSEQELAAEARRKGILINTIRCGDLEDTERMWKLLAKGAGGTFATIGQNGGMVAVRTPMDERLRELNERLTSTAVYYGGDEDRRAAAARAEGNRAMATESQAESARYRALSGYVDSNDLVTAVAKGKAKVEELAPEALPAPMQAMAPAERRAYVEERQAEREKISAEVKELSKKRDSYLKARAPASGAPSFDDEVKDMVSKQAASINVAY